MSTHLMAIVQYLAAWNQIFWNLDLSRKDLGWGNNMSCIHRCTPP